MSAQRARVLAVALALAVLAIVLATVAYFASPNTLTFANRVADLVIHNDLLVRFGADSTQLARENPQLRLIAIDDASLAEPRNGGLGAFPWPRHVYGDLIRRLAKAGAKVVVFDVIFSENAHDPSEDRRFASAMRLLPTVLGYPVGTTSGGTFSAQPVATDLRAATAGSGFTTVDVPGGMLSGQPLTIVVAEGAHAHAYRSLAAAAAERYTHGPLRPQDAWSAQFRGRTVPLDGEGRLLLLPFVPVQTAGTTGAGQNFQIPFAQTMSFPQALHSDEAGLRDFASGKLIVVGATAQSLGDYITMATGRYPGVFANVRLMDQLLSGRYIRRAPPALEIFLMLVLPLLIACALARFPASVGILSAVGALVLYTIVDVVAYARYLYWLDLLHVGAAMLLTTLLVALYRVVTEGADKRMIRELFGMHVSRTIVDDMLKSDDPRSALKLAGKRVKSTVFYSDIRGFTAMSEKMTPEEIYEQLNEYFAAMCAIIFKYGGYIDKFIGDCVMAVFSAPNPTPDDAYKAVRAALEQQQKIADLSSEWNARGKQPFTVGMGINTGDVIMGNLGSAERLNYTVIGDNVNVASRLYNVARGGQIIISESTYEEVKDRFEVRELEPVHVKGKTLPLRNFEVLGLR